MKNDSRILGGGSNQHFFITFRGTEAQRGGITCLGSYGQVLLESKLKARLRMHNLSPIMRKYWTNPK